MPSLLAQKNSPHLRHLPIIQLTHLLPTRSRQQTRRLRHPNKAKHQRRPRKNNPPHQNRTLQLPRQRQDRERLLPHRFRATAVRQHSQHLPSRPPHPTVPRQPLCDPLRQSRPVRPAMSSNSRRLKPDHRQAVTPPRTTTPSRLLAILRLRFRRIVTCAACLLPSSTVMKQVSSAS